MRRQDNPWLKAAQAIILQGMFAYPFYGLMAGNSKVQDIAGDIGLRAGGLAALVTLLGMGCSFYFCRKAVDFCISVPGSEESISPGRACTKVLNSRRWIMCLRILIVLCFLSVIVCAFSPTIWLDEAFTLGLIKHDMADVIGLTAQDVHPPLYYLMLKMAEDLFSCVSGTFAFRAAVAKLFSAAAFAATAALCWVKFRREETKGFRELLVLCLFATSGILSQSIEIRMYGWALFFVTGTYLYAKEVMDGGSGIKTWGPLVVFSVCSAYTHNYALISMGAVWLYLLIWVILKNRKEVKNWLMGGTATAVCYVPWLLVLMKQTSRVSENYWISDINMGSIWSCVVYVFPFIFAVIPVVVLTILQRKENRKELLYLLSGAAIPAMTFAVGVAVSVIICPIFVNRYMVPGLFCLWISILMCWRRMHDRQKAIVAGIIVCGCVMFGAKFFIKERAERQRTEESLAFFSALEKDSIVCVGCEKHVWCVVAAYMDDREVYCVTDGRYVVDDLWQSVFPNLKVRNYEFITEALRKGRTVYLMRANAEPDVSSWESVAVIDPLGELDFREGRAHLIMRLYRLSPRAVD